MRAAEKIHPKYSKEWFSGIDPNAFLVRSYTTMHNEANKERIRLAHIIDAELASESLEQRATAAAEEIEGNMIPIRSGQSNVVRAQKIILRHFSGLGGGNERKELIAALKLARKAIDVVCDQGVEHDDLTCPEDDTCTCPNIQTINGHATLDCC